VLRSAVNLAIQCFELIGRAASSAVKGDRKAAADYIRALAIFVHDDLVSFIIKLQRPATVDGPNGPNRILVVKLDRIGDMVNTTPVFDALRTRFPSAKIDVAGHPVPLSLLEDDERIDQRFVYRSWLYHPVRVPVPTWSELALILRLVRRRYPLVVYLRGSFPFLLLGTVSPLIAAKFVAGEPVVDRYLRPLERQFGPVQTRLPRLRIAERASEQAAAIWRGGANGGARVVIHAAAAAGKMRWPSERFARVADQLHTEFRAHVCLFGSAADAPLLEEVLSHSEFRHTVHLGVPLGVVAAAISSSDLFIGNDSGLSHVAAAVNTPTIVIWGAANLNMARPVMPSERCVLLYHELSCRATCDEIRCSNDRYPTQCLLDTSAEAVIAAAKRLLSATAPGRAGQGIR
jgi:heptosyltransferase-2/heptosyltransferase-3